MCAVGAAGHNGRACSCLLGGGCRGQLRPNPFPLPFLNVCLSSKPQVIPELTGTLRSRSIRPHSHSPLLTPPTYLLTAPPSGHSQPRRHPPSHSPSHPSHPASLHTRLPCPILVPPTGHPRPHRHPQAEAAVPPRGQPPQQHPPLNNNPRNIWAHGAAAAAGSRGCIGPLSRWLADARWRRPKHHLQPARRQAHPAGPAALMAACGARLLRRRAGCTPCHTQCLSRLV